MNESISVTRKPSKSKPYSASEIAKNPRLFEKWSTAHGCRDASWGDIPEDILDSVSSVFNTNGTIPHAWVDSRSEVYRCLKMTAPLGLLTFLRKAHQDRPELFSNRVDATANRELLVGITMIFKAWQCLTTNKESWSEADYVANVHNTCRNAAVNASSYRAQTTLSLPQPLSLRVTARTVRVVNSTTIVPDNLLFLPKRLCHKLCSGSRSPFSRLRWDDAVVAISDTTSAERAFVYQATPCAQLPETERFEFVSSVSEDKKTVKEGKQEAYRQNRMATASVIRQLAAFGVEPVPIFGLVWENGTVQAHVDWYATQEGKPAILSAPYIKDEAAGGDAHKWRLATPGDMLEVFVLIRNIDAWTVDGFYRRVARGVTAMADRVCSGARAFVPWRRAGELVPAPRRSAGAVVSGAGAHRTTVVRRDVVEESVATEGRTRTQRLSMESVEVVEDIPVPVAKASGKRNARATNAGLSRGKGKLALATVEEVAPKRPAGSKAAAGPSKKSDKPNARGPLQEKAKAPQLELSGRPRVQTRSRPYRQNALDAMVLRRSPRKRG